MPLPDIDIAISGDRTDFLDGMVALGQASGRFKAERVSNALGEAGYEAATFELLEASAHQDLNFALLSPPDRPATIRVELTAHRWAPEPPTYDAYAEAAQVMIKPLLSAWNTASGTRYRLRIERRGAGRWQATARTRELVERFGVQADTASLHPLDWQRFYRLVKEGRQEIPEPALRAMLSRHGFSAQKAEDLAALYGHLWAFKQLD
ncbi:hypothetical protein [Caulobacter sp. RHG1]|uniref:hypothetical protein n=1 Tax=Caulobacter sp. (strain RHG1) TaxID=2545762 RepID=UPI00155517A2|nr:hypothetical protein [Caulobacter sp. RHG1]NQE63582.1 hypothetical protein [Caulobacter sp. RHG1]